jgi:hypothetical protein
MGRVSGGHMHEEAAEKIDAGLRVTRRATPAPPYAADGGV